MNNKGSCNLNDEPFDNIVEGIQSVSAVLTSINKNESKSNPSILPDLVAKTRECDAHEIKNKKLGTFRRSTRLNQNVSKKLAPMRSKGKKADIMVFKNKGYQKIKAENEKFPELQLCKSYLQNRCNSSLKCEFMHSEFPCLYYYLGLDCKIEKSNKQDNKCKLSHGGPLSKDIQDVLLQHIVHASKVVLGKQLVQIRNQLTEAGIMKKITDFQQKLSSQSSVNLEENNDKNNFFFKNLYFLTKEQFAHLEKLGVYEIDQLWDLTLRQLNAIGLCATQIEMISLILEKNTDFSSLKSRFLKANEMKPCYLVSTANSGVVMESPLVLDERDKENHVMDENKTQEILNNDVSSNKKLCFHTESVDRNEKYHNNSVEYKHKSKDRTNSENVDCKNDSNLLSEEKEIEKAVQNYKDSFGFSPSKSFREKLRQKKNPFEIAGNRFTNKPDQDTTLSVMVFNVQKKNNLVDGSCSTNDFEKSEHDADEEVTNFETFCPFNDDFNNLLGPNCEEKRNEIIRLTARYLTEKNKKAKYELKKLIEVKTQPVIKDIVIGSDQTADSQPAAGNNQINNYEIVKECNSGTSNSKHNISTDPDHDNYVVSDGSLKDESDLSNQNRMIIDHDDDDVFVQGKITGDCLLSKKSISFENPHEYNKPTNESVLDQDKNSEHRLSNSSSFPLTEGEITGACSVSEESCSFGNSDEYNKPTNKSVLVRDQNFENNLSNSSSFTLTEGTQSNSSFIQENSLISDFPKECNQQYSYVRRILKIKTNIKSTSITTDQNHTKDPRLRNILKRPNEETNNTSSSLECSASVQSCDHVKESEDTIAPVPNLNTECQRIVSQKLLSDWDFDEDNGPSVFIQTSESLPSDSLIKSSDLNEQITTEKAGRIVDDFECPPHKNLSTTQGNCKSISERFSETEPVVVSPQRLKAGKLLRRSDSDEENWDSDQSETEKSASAATSPFTFQSFKSSHPQEKSGYGNRLPRIEHIDLTMDKKLVIDAIEGTESIEACQCPTQDNCKSISGRFSETEPLVVSPQRLKAGKLSRRSDPDEENWDSDQSETEKSASAATSPFTFQSFKSSHPQEKSGYGNRLPRVEHIDLTMDKKLVIDAIEGTESIEAFQCPTQDNCKSISGRFSETEPLVVSPQRLKAGKLPRRSDPDEENWDSDQSETEKSASAATSPFTLQSFKSSHQQEKSGYGNRLPRVEHIDLTMDKKLVIDAIEGTESIEAFECPPPWPKISTLNDYQPATEIDASMTWPPIPYQLYEILFPPMEVNKPRSDSSLKLSQVTYLDPRLLKSPQYFDANNMLVPFQNNMASSMESPQYFDANNMLVPFQNNMASSMGNVFSFFSMASSTNSSINYNLFNASPIIYRYLQKSSWYQTLNPNMKIEINRSISKLVRFLNSYHQTPFASRPTFDLLQIDCGGELLEILKNIGIYIDRNGSILEDINSASAENTRDNMSMSHGIRHPNYTKNSGIVQSYRDSSFNYDLLESPRSYGYESSEPYNRSGGGRARRRGRGRGPKLY